VTYPPEPWVLRGQMYVSLWLVPRAALPPLSDGLARDVRPVTIGGRAVVGTAWVGYEPGGVLHYREVLAAILVRAGLRPRVSITHIWVDDPVSREGGRALWGIPKELADIALTAPTDGAWGTATARTTAGVFVRALLRSGRRLPGRWPVRFTVTQRLDTRTRNTPVRCHARLATAAAAWEVEPTGPLAYLAGRRPLLTVRLRDVRLVFGTGPSSRS